MKLYFKKNDDGESLELKLLTYFEIHLERKNIIITLDNFLINFASIILLLVDENETQSALLSNQPL